MRWPLIAWAHPTTGVVPRCAPSQSPLLFPLIPGLGDMLARGYVVAATDYPGLGTIGPHPFLVGDSEARAVIDSVRAAVLLPGSGAASRFAVWGHSQGGQAAIFTGIIAKRYAPDLTLVGVAAASPAIELAELLKEDLGSSGGDNLTSMALWSWAQVYDAPIATVLEPAATPIVATLAHECIGSIRDSFQRRRSDHRLATSFLAVADLTTTEPWRGIIASNTPGPLPPEVPVFLAQGQRDTLVRPALTGAYMRTLCLGGSRVHMVALPAVKHGFSGFRSSRAAIAWIADRFAGLPPPSECAVSP